MNDSFHMKKYVREREIYTMNYQETLEYMESLQGIGIIPGLSGITALCAELGNPQESLSFVHIAGTNGKGSVLAYISTVLKCAGYRVGRYLSPVIKEYREKIQVDGRPIFKQALCDCMERVEEACKRIMEKGHPHPTAFEVETAAAFLYFQEKDCDIVVLETGMGGREDATNLIHNTKIAVLTSISMDHMQYLGKSLTEIAFHKAGIIKEGCHVISVVQEPEVLSVLERESHDKGAVFTVAGEALKIRYGLEKQKFSYVDSRGRRYENLEIALAGKHQIENAVLAVEAIGRLEEYGYPVKEDQLRRGLLATEWPGRFQIVGKKPLFVLDGAHNEDAAKKLADSVRFYFTNKRIIYIMGMLRDKEYENVIAETYAYADQIITLTPPENPRALPALNLAEAVREYHPRVTAAGSLEEAVEMAYLLAGREDVILAFGSLSYLGRLQAVLEKRRKKPGKER